MNQVFWVDESTRIANNSESRTSPQTPTSPDWTGPTVAKAIERTKKHAAEMSEPLFNKLRRIGNLYGNKDFADSVAEEMWLSNIPAMH